MLRPVLLRRYLAVMQAKGYKTASVLSGCDFDPSRIDDENYLIDLATFYQLIENMIALCGDGGIGLDVGLAHRVEDFGILAYASMSGKNQYQNTNEIWNRYGESVGIMTKLSQTDVGQDLVEVGVEAAATSEAVLRFFVEELLGVYFSIGADWVGRPPKLKRAQFSYARPNHFRRYEALLDCPIKFNASTTRLTFFIDWFREPLNTPNLELKRIVEQGLGDLQQKISESSPLVARVRDVFLRRHGKIVKIDEAAKALRMSARTLSRQLQSRNLSYQKILDQYLHEAATELIHRKPDKAPIKEISGEMGFSDVNAFRRAFKRWTGTSIQEYRAEKARKLRDCL